ncbi:magnesium transporter NIPA-domain-containing protein [Gilbertella persicaria]|uniref:magnesium transporter NIPA-domain-containing protein n=1 Tax=Gilbertella persicaria TaxID=101096 RepID=UPI0022209C19|nr:magnesium transporter NIPA-domain-containing protein [Gilbertella persicaria]KAI8097828.1 magnesium transporter NIPA-domain-containing protein [Gilbertella persicaria]
MSSTNGTTNPFATDTTGAQAGLYKGIGVSLAIASGLFIGSSFVFKKKGLLQSIEKSGGVAGEGYTYLKNAMWWTGMIMMIVGELCNFIAYAFTQAILVTPLGALSVVISAVLSSIFLKERLSFQGKIGCFQCILGAIVIVLHAPEQSSADTSIEAFKHLVLSIGFLIYAGIAVAISLVLVFYCGPKWGKKNMLIYITVCSLIGSISVVFTQGLGAAIVHSISQDNQFTNWFIYIVLGIVVVTLIVEIVYLNKALNLFNTALVTPTYYVIFTTMTIVSSIVLYQGFDASAVDIVTCVIGFFSICSGVALLHNSKSQPEPEKVDTKEVKVDDEKILVDEEQQTPTKRRHSLFKMFENTDATEEQHGAHDPGAADLFPAPFTGIGRYASTTKKSQSIIVRHRERSTPITTIPKTKSRPHSNTISIGNTAVGEEGYNRELKWRNQPTHDITVNVPNTAVVDELHSSPTTISEELVTPVPSSTGHRVQDQLDPITSYRMQVNDGDTEDRERLI